VSGGGSGLFTPDHRRDRDDTVRVAREAAAPAPALAEFNQAEVAELMKMALDGTDGAPEVRG
jgi:hypothetical protein